MVTKAVRIDLLNTTYKPLLKINGRTYVIRAVTKIRSINIYINS